MDFTKLNIEFANMQNKINEYNNLVALINNKIRDISKEIGKYDTKIKNTTNKIEIDLYSMMINIYNEEKCFLKSLIIKEKNENKDVKRKDK